MGVISAFDEYVANRLDAWGREFRLDRRFEHLDSYGKNLLVVLIEHKGQIPPRNVGFKPLSIPLDELQIEDLVREVHADSPKVAAVLRAYYGGLGRNSTDRRKLAEKLYGKPIKRCAYYSCHDIGFHRIAGALTILARCA